MEQARIVIIGGGVVGVSALYHLAKAGWTDAVLLERNELTAGSTWHAAGNCPTFSASWAVMHMQRVGAELYREMDAAGDVELTYNVTGSIRLAHSKNRMMEFERARGMGRAQGMSMEIMSPQDARDAYPFLETHDLEGALWDPADGDMDPASLTQALATRAKALGAKIHRFRPATGMRREDGEWIVETEAGPIRCEYVVNAAGYYAQAVGEWFRPYGGRRVPMCVMQHQYLLTEEIPEIAAWTAEQGRKLPLLRDVDVSYYLRQEKTGLNLGPYERNCRTAWTDTGVPEDFSFQLFEDDLERLEPYIEDAMARVPLLGRAGISKVINGPIPYAPDGNPLIGPMPGVPNAFEACVFTFGIAQGGGAGKLLADWVVEGQTEWDAWACDPRRYTDYADDAYAEAKAVEVYGHEYAMHFPRHRWPAGAEKKVSALHSRLKEAGAVFGAYNGWERADWFAKDGDDRSEEATQRWDREGPWEARVAEECRAVATGCGALPITGFSRYRVTGPGAVEYVASLTASRMPREGRIALLYFANEAGRCVTEMSAMVRGGDVHLITAAVAQWHDIELLRRGAPEGVEVLDETEALEAILVTGPKAREVLGPITTHDLSLPWLSVSEEGAVARVPCTLVRVSFAGELGWEVHCASDASPAIWDALMEAGATPFGMWALDRLRMEKGYLAWKQDLSTDYSLLELGLDRFVDFSRAFPGKAALQSERQRGSARRFTTLEVRANGYDAPYMSNVWSGDEIVGETLSGGYGYRTDASLALAMLKTGAEGPLEVEIFGARYPAEEREGFDPRSERVRA